ncbi:hypothetical protein NZD88_20835, partial [Chryseobacterium antibioticum]
GSGRTMPGHLIPGQLTPKKYFVKMIPAAQDIARNRNDLTNYKLFRFLTNYYSSRSFSRFK